MADISDNECDLDLLNALLGNADEDKPEENDVEIKTALQELDFNFVSSETNIKDLSTSKSIKESPKKVDEHSSDEDKDYIEKRKYSEYGQEIKQLLKHNESEKKERVCLQSFPKTNTLSTNILKKSNTSTPLKINKPTNNSGSKNVYSDPVFGYAINKPLISSAELVQLMEGRKPVSISNLKQFLSPGKPSEDWVVAGVLTYKSPSKQTSKGDSFAIWKISDMSMNMNTISVFLFRNAYQSLWKIMEGSVLAILNANVMENRDKNDIVSISVDNPAKVMILGTSRDMGTCKSKKKNGDPCTSIVNIRLCEYCVYHVKQEYSKHSRRSDLQSSFNGKGVTMTGINKNPFKNSINKFANIDQNLKTVPSKKNLAMVTKDRERLEQLKSNAPAKPVIKHVNNDVKPKARMVELTGNQIKKDINRLNKLKSFTDKPNEIKEEKLEIPVKTSPPSKIMLTPKTALSTAISATKATSRYDLIQLKSSHVASKSPLMAPKTSQELKYNQNVSKKSSTLSKSPLMAPKKSQEFDLNTLSGVSMVPKLGVGSVNGTIDLSSPIPRKKIDLAKNNALEWIRQNGSIKPSNPNKILVSKEAQAKHGAKRKRVDEEKDKDKKNDKDSFTEKFRKLMETKSSHTDLIKKAEDEEEDKYFNKMETKEKMEQKMLTTFQVPCKAVQCAVCKYTAFSASNLCKQERHPIKVLDANKRFYKCGDCGNRTVTLDRIPSTNCSKCNSLSWVKTAMMDEKRTKIKTAHLSIRGDEEKYYGNADNANINLIVSE